MGRVILLALLLTACTETIIREVPEVPPRCYEERASAPGFTSEELQKIPRDIYFKLAERDDTLTDEIVKYEEMCEKLKEQAARYE